MARFLLAVATLMVASSSVLAQQRPLQGSRKASVLRESFEDRMKMYTDWARFTQAHGRRLATAPTAAVPLTYGTTPLITPAYGSTPPTTPTPPTAPTPPAYGAAAPTGGSGECKVLRWTTGFANTTLLYDKIIYNSPNFGECCKSCSADPQCLEWTRVAGGDPANFRNCYLKYNLTALDPSPAAEMYNHVGHAGDSTTYPELRYVNEGYPTSATPLILESGTTPDVYPADYYGCPYPPGNAATPCVAPATCNMNGDGVFVPPACIGS